MAHLSIEFEVPNNFAGFSFPPALPQGAAWKHFLAPPHQHLIRAGMITEAYRAV